MYDISISKSEIWNIRLKSLLRERGLSQESFADALHKKYGTKFTQRVISRWTRVGNKIETKSGLKDIGFPDFKNMLLIADFFNVDVGYLIGETNEDTFDLEKTCAFMELNGNAVKAILEITEPDREDIFWVDEKRDTLNKFLEADGFYKFIDSLNDVHNTSLSSQHMDSDKTICIEYVIDFLHNLEYQEKIVRYDLNEALVLLVNEIYPKALFADLPEGYGQCDFCHSASPYENDNDPNFICPIKKKPSLPTEC